MNFDYIILTQKEKCHENALSKRGCNLKASLWIDHVLEQSPIKNPIDNSQKKKKNGINHNRFTHQKRRTFFWRSIIIICTYNFLLSSPPHHIKYQKALETIMNFNYYYNNEIWFDFLFFFFLLQMPVWRLTTPGIIYFLKLRRKYDCFLRPHIFFRLIININTRESSVIFGKPYHMIKLTSMSSGLLFCCCCAFKFR